MDDNVVLSSYVKHPTFGTVKIIQVYVDINFTKSQILSIRKSIDIWNKLFQDQLFIEIVSYDFDMEPSVILKIKSTKNSWMFLKVPETSSIVPGPILKNGKIHYPVAFTNATGGDTIYVIDYHLTQLSNTSLDKVLNHEIGHLFGLEHVNSPTSLMFDSYNEYAYSCIDKVSAMLVAKRYSLELHIENTCKLQ